MKKIILLKGLPASGKTTFAKEVMEEKPGAYVRTNKDELRAMMHNGKWSNHNEKQIIRMRDKIVIEALESGRHVIVDDTNLHHKHEDQMRIIAKKHDARVQVVKFLDISVEECIKRDLKRENSVGQKVILKMYHQFLRKSEVGEGRLNPMVFDSKLPYCVIFDLDGTLAHITDRSPYDGKACASDELNKSIYELWESLAGKKRFILSGRNGESREETEEWLDSNDIFPTELIMRKEGDSRKDSIIKEELFNEHIKDKYNVLFVVDDRKQVVELWRSLGLTVLQCAEGDF